MARILIAGCGDIGTKLGLELAQDNHEVWGVTRTSTLPEPLQTIHADLADIETLKQLPKKLDYVFFMAAAPKFDEESYSRTYVNGMENLLEALHKQKQKPKHIFFTSSTAVYVQSHGEWVDEDSATEPKGFAGKAMLEAELLLLGDDYPSTIIRFSGIYGPGRTQLIERIKQEKVQQTTTTIYTNRIHADDCVGVLKHLMQLKKPDRIYIACDNEPATKNEIIRWLADTLALPTPEFSHNENTPTRGNKRCSNKKLLETGYKFIHPTFVEGFENILEQDPSE